MAGRVLFAVHDWGLGHATRSLLLIRALLARGDDVTILMAAGAGMTLLRSELGDACEFYPSRDIPKPFSRYPALFYLRMSLYMPWVLIHFRLEHLLTERLVAERRFDRVVSDSRFGIWSRAVPSYCLLHSLRQIIPGRPRWLEREVERGQRQLLAGFAKVLIPDVAENGGLSGDLGHDPALDWGPGRLEYIGPLAGLRSTSDVEDVDFFFSISGIEPQLTLLSRLVLDALPRLRGRIVVTLGRPDQAGTQSRVGGATVHGYLDRRTQAEMVSRARVTMTRSGYMTLMELAALGKRALFVPTPGQSEQEYLADLHCKRGNVWSTTQRSLDLATDLARAAAAPGLPRIACEGSAERFLAAIA